MSEDTWDAVRATPLAEVRRRAAIVGEIVEVAPGTVDGARRFGWNDGGGQSAVWYFTGDGRGLLLTRRKPKPPAGRTRSDGRLLPAHLPKYAS